MELMTKAIEAALLRADSPVNRDRRSSETPIVVKYFNPAGAQTWFIVSGEEEEGDWRLYGWCELGFGPGCDELGYVMLSELQSIKGVWGIGIERDRYYDGHTLDEVIH